MISGIQFAAASSGIKPSGPDIGLAVFREGMHVSSLYTRNRVRAAHIIYNKKMTANPVRALLVNSGCANACTGKEGIEDLHLLAERLAKLLHVNPEEIIFASTGVIGKRLPVDKMLGILPILTKNLKEGNLELFARSIMTTDTHQKVAQEIFEGKKNYTIMGVAKGSGMINPLFATMLAFLFTDYPSSPQAIRKEFLLAARESFERITVDGECSTNDTILLFTKKGSPDTKGMKPFYEKFSTLMKKLSLMVVHDGEGATRVIHIVVKGAKNQKIAEKIARRIAISPLTKTAFFGCDPNWGRIMAAVGDADTPLNPSRVEIIMQGEVLAREGKEIPFDEGHIKNMMNKKEIDLIVNLHSGNASFDIYTTDLTYDYIKINASYRS